MAVLDRLDTLAPIREKVLAGERLDFDDGVALMETDDLLALGELADLARRQRGCGDEVYFVQNINLYQTNVCRVKCKFCAFAKTNKQEDAFTLSADEFVEDAVAAARAPRLHRDPHGQRREPARRPRLLRRAPAQAEGGAPGRPSQVLHGLRDPPHLEARGLLHEEVLRTLQDAGLDSMPGGGAEIFADRVRAARRARQGASGRVVPRPRHRAPDGDHDAVHDALRPRRDVRGARRPPAAAARPAGRDRAASSRSSRSRSIPRTPSSSAAASASRPAPTT